MERSRHHSRVRHRRFIGLGQLIHGVNWGPFCFTSCLNFTSLSSSYHFLRRISWDPMFLVTLSSLRRIYFIWLPWWWFWGLGDWEHLEPSKGHFKGWDKQATDPEFNLNTFPQSGLAESAASKNQPEQADLLPFNLYPGDPRGQIRETPALAKCRGGEGPGQGTATRRSRAGRAR